MTRLLPIVLVAFGLMLAFSSLAVAQTPHPAPDPGNAMCIEETAATPVAHQQQPERKGVRCWKTLKTGVLATPCPPEPILDAAAGFCFFPRTTHGAIDMALPPDESAGPALHLPPPRA